LALIDASNDTTPSSLVCTRAHAIIGSGAVLKVSRVYGSAAGDTTTVD
jgi:hypothetical protein